MKNQFYTFLILVTTFTLYYVEPVSEKNNESTSSVTVRDGYNIDFYPSYAYNNGEDWIVPVTYYVYKQRNYLESFVSSFIRLFRDFTPEETELFRSRIQYFTADSESREQVRFIFDNDPDQKIYTVQDSDGNPVQTNLNGMAQGTIKIPTDKANELKNRQHSEDGWLSIRAISDDHTGTGKIRLIPPKGTSVISDIDDTIKISELPAGSRIAARNAFVKEYIAAPEMAELFKQWNDAAIHYVSGTPKQFFRPLTQFMFADESGFPLGSMHLRDVRKNFLSLSTWRDLEDIISDENITYQHKLEEMTKIISDFPDRSFYLVGDSGQHDPEIFRKINEMFPGQIMEIIIRDIKNDRERNPERLEGMTIIPADLVEEGVSIFN